jgi:hypothetical protein
MSKEKGKRKKEKGTIWLQPCAFAFWLLPFASQGGVP